jgi:short-subunit dehydrogenase
MKIGPGQTVLLTGASGGLGVFIGRAFAKLGARLALVAYPGVGLEALRQETERLGAQAIALTYDLRDPQQRRSMVAEVQKQFGGVDILVNNAGVEFTSAYHDLSEENIHDIIGINLEAAMVLTRLVLPDMLQKKRGHIVNISSLAGKAIPAFQEPYAATKAGLIAFTFSLRATYRNHGVSASAIVPGFVEAGIYAKLKKTSGCSAPALLGTSSPEKVAAAVLKAVERDAPEIIINPIPVRPLLALATLFPSLGEWALRQTGGHDFFKQVVEAQRSKKSGQ